MRRERAYARTFTRVQINTERSRGEVDCEVRCAARRGNRLNRNRDNVSKVESNMRERLKRKPGLLEIIACTRGNYVSR